jgi:hypothetical protein
MQTRMAMVVLTEYRGESTTYLIPIYVLDWINQPYDRTKLPASNYKEQLPDNIRDFFIESAQNSVYHEIEDIEDTIEISIGSAQNDRALHLIVADSLEFSRTTEVFDFTADNNMLVVATFEGMVY